MATEFLRGKLLRLEGFREVEHRLACSIERLAKPTLQVSLPAFRFDEFVLDHSLLFQLSGFAGGRDLSEPAGKPRLFKNPNSLGVMGSTETVRQSLGAFAAAMGGAKSRPERV